MKNYYLLLFLFIGFFGKAQIITIPDANFKAKLLAASPSNTIAKDLSGIYFKIDANNDSEIEVSEALNVSYLYLFSSSIQSLDGIINFSNLKRLHCSQNQLLSLNVNGLVNLTHLYCNNNQVTSLNVSGLVNLKVLNCSFNQLSNLDVSDLVNLTGLNCNNNQLASLNLTGLINLLNLECHDNQISNLNVSGLVNLTGFYCYNNQLPNLNVSGLVNLTHLYCDNNQLSSLNVSELVNLYELRCQYNQISILDASGLVYLISLNCSNNQISSLNVNGLVNLEYLICNDNQISSLNVYDLVNLYQLRCQYNQLLTLDISNLLYAYSLNCSNNQLTSLFMKNGDDSSMDFHGNPNLIYICADENEIVGVQSQLSILQYSNTHVNSYCSFVPGGQFYTIQGQNKFDNENNGCDITDNFIPNLKYSITDGTNVGSLISDNTGSYSIPVQAGSHTIVPILENPSYFTVSPPNVVVNFPTQTSPFTQNFCITPNGAIHDVEISVLPLNPARPGFDCNYKIVYKNKGNQTENGTINLAFDDAILDFVSSSDATSSQTFGNLNWNYSNLQPFESREIMVVLNLNSPLETPAVNAGDLLSFTATNTIVNTDEMLSDNTFVLNQIVVNSYDPNDKTCLQGNYVGPDKIGKFVHYVIRFENTGTFPAENIVVKDIIDTAKFDINSLVPMNGSHSFITRITGTNKVEFIFENINLPFDDANNDGYIAFKIKTLPSLIVGNTFSNSANIYFDYNFPIVTNTASTNIVALNNPSFEFADYFSLYPNPTTNELNINLKSSIEINSIQIYNTIGQLVTVQTGNAFKVDVSHLKTGNYFIKINTNEGFSTSQFIKE